MTTQNSEPPIVEEQKHERGGTVISGDESCIGVTVVEEIVCETVQYKAAAAAASEEEEKKLHDKDANIIIPSHRQTTKSNRIELEDAFSENDVSDVSVNPRDSFSDGGLVPSAPRNYDTRDDYLVALEQRVQELEEKLASLSFLLQRQQHFPSRMYPSSPFTAMSLSPPRSPQNSNDEQTHNVRMMLTPSGLESPPPQRRPCLSSSGTHKRNLSYRVLHTDDFAQTASDLASSEDDEDMKFEEDEALLEGSPMTMHEGSQTPPNLYLPESLPGNSTRQSSTNIVSSASPPSIHLSSKTETNNVFSVCSGAVEQQNQQQLTVTETSPANLGTQGSSDNVDSASNNNSKKQIGKEDPLAPSPSPPLSSTPDKSVASGITPVMAADRNSLTIGLTSTFSPNRSSTTSMKSKWLDYLNSVQESNYDTDKQMEEFVKVPSAVESLLSFGFWICVDSFLYSLTILPIRFIWSCLLLIRLVFVRVFKSAQVADGPFRFHRRHSYQLIQVSIIYSIYKYVLKPIDISIIYHWIRVQNMVKLYLLIAIVEVFDRLMCSLGQDCLDSLYWNTTRRPRSSRLIVSIIVVLTYTAVHSMLLFIHVATMNVAMNSDDQALLSLLIGGNFAEIKSTVFKKYNKAALFKITATDICERFKLALFLVLVLTLNLSQGMDKTMIYKYMHMCGIVWCAEWLSDWVKHAFITKANYIASGVYSEYGLLLAGDNSGFGHEGENLDHSHAVVKRLGFSQIPLVCVMAKYLKESYKYGTYGRNPQTWMIVLGFFAIWLLLLVCKLSLGSFLHRMSRIKLEAAPEFSKNNTTVAKKKN